MLHNSAFREGERVYYQATNKELIPTTILRLCADGQHCMCQIDGRVGEQWEPIYRLIAMPERVPAIFVIVKGSNAQASRAAEARGIDWTRKRSGTCRAGQGEACGIVPASQLGLIVQWFLEDVGTDSAVGSCLFYSRTTEA